jgi:hypothetical protein
VLLGVELLVLQILVEKHVIFRVFFFKELNFQSSDVLVDFHCHFVDAMLFFRKVVNEDVLWQVLVILVLFQLHFLDFRRRISLVVNYYITFWKEILIKIFLIFSLIMVYLIEFKFFLVAKQVLFLITFISNTCARFRVPSFVFKDFHCR